MMYDHECDGECTVCQKPACEFCGTVAHNSGNLYCSDHTFEADVEDYEDEEDLGN